MDQFCSNDNLQNDDGIFIPEVRIPKSPGSPLGPNYSSEAGSVCSLPRLQGHSESLQHRIWTNSSNSWLLSLDKTWCCGTKESFPTNVTAFLLSYARGRVFLAFSRGFYMNLLSNSFFWSSHIYLKLTSNIFQLQKLIHNFFFLQNIRIQLSSSYCFNIILMKSPDVEE